MRFLVVAYYTIGTPYEQESEILRLSLNAHRIPHAIHGVPNLGSWQKNTQFKSEFIKRMLAEHPNKPLLYLDVDAIVVSPLKEIEGLLAEETDVAAVMWDGAQTLLSGTVWFSGSKKCLESVDKWNELNRKYPEKLPNGQDAWDQRTLEMAVKQTPDLKFKPLSPGYTWIAELSSKKYPEIPPVIMHTRGAFRFKRIIDKRVPPKRMFAELAERAFCEPSVFQEQPLAPALDQDRPEVWAVWPSVSVENSKRGNERWRKLGYKTGVLMNGANHARDVGADKALQMEVWSGFPHAANQLCKHCPGDIIVVIGDDVLPIPNLTAKEIGQRYLATFPELQGVIQPTGDDYGNTKGACVSPWIGRKFIDTAYGGEGPYYRGYFHYFCDGELQEVAKTMGVFHQWPDLVQYHDHWQRKSGTGRPQHLMEANRRWHEDKKLYEMRRVRGWPDHRG